MSSSQHLSPPNTRPEIVVRDNASALFGDVYHSHAIRNLHVHVQLPADFVVTNTGLLTDALRSVGLLPSLEQPVRTSTRRRAAGSIVQDAVSDHQIARLEEFSTDARIEFIDLLRCIVCCAEAAGLPTARLRLITTRVLSYVCQRQTNIRRIRGSSLPKSVRRQYQLTRHFFTLCALFVGLCSKSSVSARQALGLLSRMYTISHKIKDRELSALLNATLVLLTQRISMLQQAEKKTSEFSGDSVFFEDVYGRTTRIPLLYLSAPHVFAGYLRDRYRGSNAEIYITQQLYTITLSRRDGTVLEHGEAICVDGVDPEARLVMAIVWPGHVKSCPECKNLLRYEVGSWLACTYCGRVYHAREFAQSILHQPATRHIPSSSGELNLVLEKGGFQARQLETVPYPRTSPIFGDNVRFGGLKNINFDISAVQLRTHEHVSHVSDVGSDASTPGWDSDFSHDYDSQTDDEASAGRKVVVLEEYQAILYPELQIPEQIHATPEENSPSEVSSLMHGHSSVMGSSFQHASTDTSDSFTQGEYPSLSTIHNFNMDVEAGIFDYYDQKAAVARRLEEAICLEREAVVSKLQEATCTVRDTVVIRLLEATARLNRKSMARILEETTDLERQAVASRLEEAARLEGETIASILEEAERLQGKDLAGILEEAKRLQGKGLVGILEEAERLRSEPVTNRVEEAARLEASILEETERLKGEAMASIFKEAERLKREAKASILKEAASLKREVLANGLQLIIAAAASSIKEYDTRTTIEFAVRYLVNSSGHFVSYRAKQCVQYWAAELQFSDYEIDSSTRWPVLAGEAIGEAIEFIIDQAGLSTVQARRERVEVYRATVPMLVGLQPSPEGHAVQLLMEYTARFARDYLG